MVQARTKHVNIWYHFSSQAVKSGEVKLICCPNELMLADAMKHSMKSSLQNLNSSFKSSKYCSTRAEAAHAS